MAITIEQEPARNSDAYTAGVKTYTGLSALSVGQYVVIAAMNGNNRTFSSVTLGGQAMAAFPNNPINGVYEDQGLWFRRVTGAESGQDVVITLSGSDGNNCTLQALVIGGLAAEAGEQGAAESSASSTTHHVGPITPSGATNIVIAYAERGNRNWTDQVTDPAWHVVAQANLYSIVYTIQSSAAESTYQFSTGDTAGFAVMSIGSLNGAAGGASIVPGWYGKVGWW
jgi:hypothetical protein